MVTPVNKLIAALRDYEQWPTFSPAFREATASMLEAQAKYIAELSLPHPPPDQNVELGKFKDHFPLSVWYEHRNGFSNPIYTYGFAGWLAKCEDMAGILNTSVLNEEDE